MDPGTNFQAVVPGGNIYVFNDRWQWVTNNTGAVVSDATAISPDGEDYSAAMSDEDGEELRSFAPAWENAAFAGAVDNEQVRRTLQSTVMIVPGSGDEGLYLVSALAYEISQPQRVLQVNGKPMFGDVPLPPEWLQINGRRSSTAASPMTTARYGDWR